MVNETPAPARGSVEWWLRRLSARLDRRLGYATYRTATNELRWLPSILRWEQYYRGDLNLMLSSAKWRQEFIDRFPGYSANFMAKVVDTQRQRLAVQGIRYGNEPDADREAWDWWQRSHLDAESAKLYRETLVKGNAYQLVWPGDDGEPVVSIESADEVVVESVPGRSWDRVAALKRWIDGDDGYAYAELYLPDGVYKFRSRQRDREFSMRSWLRVVSWERYQPADEAWPVRNRLGLVPIVPFPNRPDLRGEGESEIKAVASIQDAINKYRADAIIASEFASFRQRWAIGLDIPTDPTTGEPVETFKAAMDRLWVVPPPDPSIYDDASKAPKVEFGEFEATDLAPFYKAIEGELVMLGAISDTPRHLLLPQSGQPPSADSLRVSEAGLRAKVADSHLVLGEGHEEVFRLMYLWRGDPKGKVTDAEVIWRDADTESEAARVDALVKLVSSLGVPAEAAWEELPGSTPQKLRRWRRMAAAAEIRLATSGVLGPAGSAASMDRAQRLGAEAGAGDGEA